ncbi:MAG: hypothetical protein ACI9T9_001277 [Oleiphilaceae bacterium]|jgi:hypothetical protein
MRMTESQFKGLKKGAFGKFKSLSGNKAFATATELVLSAHTKAMSALQRNPALLQGNQEHYQQVELFEFLEQYHPDIYALSYAVPNSGKRPKKTAFDMKAEGQKSGYPDTGIDAARGIYHGFRCELKTPIGKASHAQVNYAVMLRKQGYCVVFCYGFENTIKAFLEYWHLQTKEVMSSDTYK